MFWIVLMFGLIAALPVPCVYAANAQGLQWGLKGGDRLYYDTVYYTIYPDEPYTIPPRTTLHEVLYVEMYPLSPVPETVTQLEQIVLTRGYYGSNYSVYYRNGSIPGLPLSVSFAPSIFGYPVGNWSFVASLAYPRSSSGYTAIDNESMWGLEWDSTVTYVAKTAWIYSKNDGALEQYIYELHNATTDELAIRIMTTRVGNNTDTTTLTGTGLGSIPVEIALASIPIEICIAVVLIGKYRR
jgi:hypothetical protein